MNTTFRATMLAGVSLAALFAAASADAQQTENERVYREEALAHARAVTTAWRRLEDHILSGSAGTPDPDGTSVSGWSGAVPPAPSGWLATWTIRGVRARYCEDTLLVYLAPERLKGVGRDHRAVQAAPHAYATGGAQGQAPVLHWLEDGRAIGAAGRPSVMLPDCLSDAALGGPLPSGRASLAGTVPDPYARTSERVTCERRVELCAVPSSRNTSWLQINRTAGSVIWLPPSARTWRHAFTVGRHGVISADQARRRAALILARIKAGEDPVAAPLAGVEPGPAVADLAERYYREHVAVRCKPGTAKLHHRVVRKHILPEFGELAVTAIGREHVTDLHYRLRHVPSVANQVIVTLSRMINQAEVWGLAPEGGNPCRFVVKYRQRKRERFLTEDEFRRLGRVLGALEAEGRVPAPAAAAIRLLMLTGCRCNEILTLHWEDVHLDVNELRLRDSKTGPRTVPLSPAAAKVLAGLPRGAGNPWVIAGRKPRVRLSNFNSYWYCVRKRAGLEDVRLHDLRHSFASRALALGESLTMIGKLLGHTKIQTTARYAHLARDSIKLSAARVAASIGADILPAGARPDAG